MYKVLTLLRANWVAASTYRVGVMVSLFGLLATVVPLYFVANALQPTMANAIRTEGGQYFGFVLVGMIAFSFLGAAMNALPTAISSGIATGTLEALLCTPTRLPTILAGLISYQLMWVVVRTLVLLLAGSLLGASFVWGHALVGLGILCLIVIAYLAIGILAAALVLAFRTSGPLTRAVLTLSVLLGGVYYPTRVIPSWIERISDVIPLTYGLRALRGTFLGGAPLRTVLPDVLVLALFAAGLLLISAWAFLTAFDYARRAGTLSHY